MNSFIHSWVYLYTHTHTAQRSASVQTTGSDAIVIAYSAIWMVLHSWLQRNKFVYRLDSRPSPRMQGSGFASLIWRVTHTWAQIWLKQTFI